MKRTAFPRLAGLILLAGIFLTGPATPGRADDKQLREEAVKLNSVTGTTAMDKRLVELSKDEANSKKLVAFAAKIVKDEKPRPLNYNACLVLANVAQNVKDYDNALILFRACAEEASKVGSASKIATVFDGMIDLFLAQKKYKEALGACQEFLDLPIEDEEVSQQKIFVLEKQILITAKLGKHEEALKMVENLIDRDRGGWYFVRLKGEVLREAEKYGDSADAFLEAIERLKMNEKMDKEVKTRFERRIRYTLSNVYVEQKEIDKCVQQLEQLVKDEPDNATYLNDLGYILADNDRRIEDAEKMVRKALEKDGERRKKKDEVVPKDKETENGAYLDSLGWVLFKKKDYKEARKYLERATKTEEGKHIEIFDHLADVLFAMGEKAEAIKMWEEGLKFKEEDLSKREKERRKTVEKKLKAAQGK
jgi:tetratricopeptide (TPR) repeat protein